MNIKNIENGMPDLPVSIDAVTVTEETTIPINTNSPGTKKTNAALNHFSFSFCLASFLIFLPDIHFPLFSPKNLFKFTN
ncbi:hypothetical protein [Paucilactobacillus hokkaidonensis]|uniref:hypothetical protein n=1 Tax=Paucilactobacillus hokkaidonensis TaxID=1193095 RepID=UPI002091E5FB|nr:hypothetical protein [Paucilactobacillus hokkaidonensis]